MALYACYLDDNNRECMTLIADCSTLEECLSISLEDCDYFNAISGNKLKVDYYKLCFRLNRSERYVII
ncbi:hypothetical protein [Capybara microvirus Cap3_SP_581]|nr:hypothetical protein [Capybara microvirus Cap3_SP_581]